MTRRVRFAFRAEDKVSLETLCARGVELPPVIEGEAMAKLGCCVDGECTSETCMRLPEGKTCGDCCHLDRCLTFGFTESADRTECDFFPRRFKASSNFKVDPMFPSVKDNPTGLHQRYKIEKADGTPVDPRGFYFVLRLDGLGDDPIHTEACRAAAREYADKIKEHLPKLAADLTTMLDRFDSGMI